VGRILLSAAFDFGVGSREVKVNSGGQECPPHTAEGGCPS
jgi:hypothetical protein